MHFNLLSLLILPNCRSNLEKYWEDKYGSMEMTLTLDAQQADAERDQLKVVNKQRENQCREVEIERNRYKQQLLELQAKCRELQENNLALEDKCVWGLELEQVRSYTIEKIQ